MQPCYSYETLEFENPTFKQIEKTYILTMQNSSRREQYIAQLHKYKPTATVIVQNNKGFRSCSKPSWVTNSAMDLWHANLTVLQQHFEKEDTPILVLEDDIEFLDDFFMLAPGIEEFVSNRANATELYSLGSIPLLSYRSKHEHNRMQLGATSHAWIYTKKGYQKIANHHKFLFHVHDLEITSKLVTFVGSKPAAIQKMTHTENSQTWNFLNIPMTYLQLFGPNLFPFHQHMAPFGGAILITTILLLTAICTIVMLVKRSLLLLTTKTKRSPQKLN